MTWQELAIKGGLSLVQVSPYRYIIVEYKGSTLQQRNGGAEYITFMSAEKVYGPRCYADCRDYLDLRAAVVPSEMLDKR